MLVLGSNGTSGGYQITNSVRLRASASAYFSRTPSSASNRSTWTYSAWIKKAPIDYNQSMSLLSAGSFGSDLFTIQVTDNGLSVPCIAVYGQISGSAVLQVSETPARRDPSAWFHLVVVLDTTQATASNRVKIYYNGAQVTALTTATYPNQNTTFAINNNQATAIGSRAGGGAPFYDGYLAEVNFIDGQALTPSSFGATDAVTGVWNPIQYAGTYGTNGFYLKFNDTSNFGKDSSGNSNTWTSNNISNTAGATYDSMVDTPTNYGTDSGVGGEVRGNYATWNPLDSWGAVLSDGNLSFYDGGSNTYFSMPCFGKNYFEVACNNLAGGGQFGFCLNHKIATAGAAYGQAGYYGVNYASGAVSYWVNSANDGLNHGTISSNTLKFAVDSSSGKVWIGSGSSWFSGDPVAGTSPAFTLPVTNGDVIWPIGTSSSGSYILTMNAGQRPFLNTAPSGYKAMCTQNMSTPTISNGAKHMAASLYTGTGASQAINNAVNSISFQPDWVWIKSRSAAGSHSLYDVNRGVRDGLFTNVTSAENTEAAGYSMTAFNSNGFTVGLENAGSGSVNANGTTYVGWQWKGGGTGVSNTAGSITSTVSANTTAGFSIVSFTGTSSNATVGHGLGVAPSLVILKSRNSSTSWGVYHIGVGNTAALILNNTAAQNTSSTFFQNTSPTSTVFSIGTDSSVNASQPMIAYCFAPISGFSAFGSYTGNGSSDGPFVYCGFRPRFVLIKRYDAGANNWLILDTSRGPYNVIGPNIYANLSNAENTPNYIDSVSNGFKIRVPTDADINGSGATYIYTAFAENPFQISRAR
jgi:hypothetical protein